MTTSAGNTTEFLTDLFAEYDNHEVGYCLLRNYEALPERLESRDVDILIDVSSKQKNREIIVRLVEKYGAVIYNHYVDERFDQFFVFRRDSDGEFFELKLDFFFDSEIYGFRVLSGKEILQARCEFLNFFVAHDAYKVLDKWLFIFLLGAALPEKYHTEFKEIFVRHHETLTTTLANIFGRTSAEQLVTQICSTGFSGLHRIRKGELLRILLRLACKDPLYHLWHVPLFFWYRLKHTITPKGEFISLSGPDGCGKTTVMELAKEQLEKLFGSVPDNHGHFRPSFLPRIAQVAKRAGAIAAVDEDYDSPHRGKPSGFFGSLFRFSYYLLDYLVGYLFKIRPALVRRELVVYDRYYFDMVADPARSRIALPDWLRKTALSIVPLPHTAFFVHVPSDVVRKRKQELAIEKIEQLNAAYLQIAESSRLQILENSNTAEAAAAKLVDTVIARRRKRLKLDRIYP